MGEVKFNLDTNIKQKTAELKEGAMAMRQVVNEAERADRQIAKNVKAGRTQSAQKTKLVKTNKKLALTEKQVARETEKAARATERDTKAKLRSAAATETLAARENRRFDRNKRLRAAKAKRDRESSFGGRAGAFGKKAYAGGGGVVAAAAAVAVAGRLINNSFSEAAAAAMELDNAMTPLVALGENAKNYRAVSDEINTMRLVFGATAEQASQLKFNIQSGGAALDEMTKRGIRDMTLLANQVGGFDTDAISKAAIKSFNIFGKEVGSVTDVFNKFIITASDADANINELAMSMPELFAASKGVGSSMDESLAAIIALTPSAGGASKAMIQLRNMFIILKDAQLKGTLQSKVFKDQLVELGELPLAKQMQLMGRETFSSFTALTGATDIFESSMTKLQTTTGNALLEMKGLREEASEAFRITQQMKRFNEEKKIARGSDEAVSVGSELDERMDQFAAGFVGSLMKAGAVLAKTVHYTGAGLVSDSFSELGETLSSQGENEFIQANLSRMNANQLHSERMQQQTSIQLNKSGGKTHKKNKEDI